MPSDLLQLFVPTHTLLEIATRGTLVYLGLFVLMRLVLDRRSQGVSLPDVLLVVLIADASQNGMANEYRSVTEALVLAGTLLFWDRVLDWLSFHVPAFRRWVVQPPLPLVEDGRINARNMRSELITRAELEQMLRENDVEDLRDVARAFLESDGSLTVRRRSGG